MPDRLRPQGRSSDALVAERRERLLQYVLTAQEVAIADLAAEFGVSVMTVHRDLDSLVDAGLLRKSRGRAIAPTGEELATSARFRMRSAYAVKEAVAAEAAMLVSTCRVLFVDDSTSVLPVLNLLEDPSTLTVITNYLQAARVCADLGATVHLLGGELIAELDASFGATTVAAVASWHADAALMGNPAVKDGRLYHPLPTSVALKRAMLAHAGRGVLFVDHTKLGRTALTNWASGDDFDDIVVDSDADPDELAALRRYSCEVHVVEVPISSDTET
ncbi:MAG: DeoR/GlpR family DNA-binding transcription regulator [Microlunatus sp.]|nr:DeoR/GlpR family DNA-binding transcription regulator [Microlunatus sp.]